jgi:hypothetical protein
MTESSCAEHRFDVAIRLLEEEAKQNFDAATGDEELLEITRQQWENQRDEIIKTIAGLKSAGNHFADAANALRELKHSVIVRRPVEHL